MEIRNCLPDLSYSTSNSAYGTDWEKGEYMRKSFTQSTPYKALLKERRVRPNELPKDLSAVVLVHDPEDPVGIMTLSNLTTSQRGNFTNTRRQLFSNREGLWSNGMFNTPGSTIDRKVSTFSNMHGAWSRVGPSTYDALHDTMDWVDRWGTRSFEPAPLRSIYDHRNVDPRDGWVPIEPYPQNMPYP